MFKNFVMDFESVAVTRRRRSLCKQDLWNFECSSLRPCKELLEMRLLTFLVANSTELKFPQPLSAASL